MYAAAVVLSSFLADACMVTAYPGFASILYIPMAYMLALDIVV